MWKLISLICSCYLILALSKSTPKSGKKVTSKSQHDLTAPPSSTSPKAQVHISSSSLRSKKKDGDIMENLEEAILNRVLSPNSFVCEEIPNNAVSDDVNERAEVFLTKTKLKELGLKDGDVMLVRGKKRRESIAVVRLSTFAPSKSPTPNTIIFTTKRIRSNLRVRADDVLSISKVAKHPRGKSILLSPYTEDIEGLSVSVDDIRERYLLPFFAKGSVPLYKGDTFIAKDALSKDAIPHSIEFKVEDLEIRYEKVQDAVKNEDDSTSSDEESKKQLDYCVVDKETSIDCEIDTDNSRFLDPRLNELGYDDIGGCRKQLAAIRELVELPLRHPEVFSSVGIPPPRGVLLHGLSGTGKTSLARAVAAETGAYFYVLNGPEIMSKQSGESESNLRKAFEEAEKNSPAIIFIDEIDSIAPKRDKAGGEVERRIVSQLLTLFDGIKRSANVVVIAATNRPNIIDPALRRFGRFDRELLISQPSDEGRLEILRILTRDMKISNTVDLKRVAMDTHGCVGADLSAVVMEAAFAAIREIVPHIDLDADNIDPQLLNSVEIKAKHFEHAVSITNPSSLRENLVEIPDTTWADIGGLEDVKRELQEMVKLPLEFASLYTKFGTGSSKGVLMYGPPGCGKTLLAKAIANECGANFISIKGPELLDAHIGESEANIRALFDKARAAAPCILFFDEMDSIAKARGGKSGGGSGIGDNVINTILTEIDAVEESKKVFVIGATNRPDILDPSIMRPGHLDQLVYIPLPDFASRVAIFKANLRKCPVSPDVDINKLAQSTEGFSGADITEICQRAAKNAIRQDIAVDIDNANNILAGNKHLQRQSVQYISKHHFEEAMSRARRSVSETQIEQYKQFIQKQKADASSAVGFKFKDTNEEGGDAHAGKSSEDAPLYG